MDGFRSFRDIIPDTDDENSDYELDVYPSPDYITNLDSFQESIDDDSGDERTIDGVINNDILDDYGNVVIHQGSNISGEYKGNTDDRLMYANVLVTFNGQVREMVILFDD
jgi:hypothetical protein